MVHKYKQILLWIYTCQIKVDKIEIIEIACHCLSCKQLEQNNIDLIVLNTPLDPYYKSKIPQKFLDKYNQIIETQKLRVIDFHNLKFRKNDFIKDGDYVSVEGSLLISKFLNNQF